MKFPSMIELKNKITRPIRGVLDDSEGVVLAAVLIFIAMILPVTLVILNTIEIETMLPTNEGLGRIASHEADKGFDMAMAALLSDNQDGFSGDIITDPTRPVPTNFPAQITPTDSYYVPGMAHGRHDVDYLAESWARHPENYTYFLSEHSRENEVHPDWNPDPPGDPDEYSVPTRWVMMNVPFGLDDHGERSIDQNSQPDILTDMENRSTASVITPVNAYAADTAETDELQSPPVYVTEDWRLSPSHPDFKPPRYIARPASYLRNTNPGYASSLAMFDNQISDSLVYDSGHDDLNGDGALDPVVQNQYLNNPELQEAVSDSTWSNLHFGSGAQSARNKEYKPLPGTVTQYPVGSTGEDFIPAWFESIVSDESARFNLNAILNIVFQGGNYDYNSRDASPDVPVIKYDEYYADAASSNDVMFSNSHSNYSNALLAVDMIAALLMEDNDLKSQDHFNQAQEKARWILRNMLVVRERLDGEYDADGDGIPDEITIANPDGSALPGEWSQPSVWNGRGRMGDAPHPWQGTWKIYANPKDFLNDPLPSYYGDFPPYRPITDSDFKVLHNNCTVYTYETQHIADTPTSGSFDDAGLRLNFNTSTSSAAILVGRVLNPLIGSQRTASLFRWRDGLVDLNRDGDLNDEYVLQPVKDPGTADSNTNVRGDGEAQPVSEITYRERNNVNFQNPADPKIPGMLNIPDLGSLLLVPMSVRETQIIASTIDQGTGTIQLNTFDPNATSLGIPIPNTDDAYVCDIDFTGTKVIHDEINNLEEFFEVDIPRGLNSVPIDTNAQGYHPSYGPDASQFLYVDKDTTTPGLRTISIWDIPTATRVRFQLNRNIPLATMVNMPTPLGDEYLEPASPDWSPTGRQIAFAGGGSFDASAPFASHTDIYTVRISGPGQGIPDNITNLRNGQYAFYPDFSEDGEWIAYTYIDITEFTRPNPRPFKIRVQNLVDNSRREFPQRGGPDIIDPLNGYVLGIDLIPFAPDWSPSGTKLCFMGFTLAGGIPDIYTISNTGTNLRNITNTPGIAEMFPSWGYGLTVIASQKNNHPGSIAGTAVNYPAGPINPDNDPWDADYRQQLAQVIQNASLAFRRSDTTQDQNWRYMDLPVVPQHMADALQGVADLICFQPTYYTTNPGIPGSPRFPYAIPGKVNINTASYKVLRALFLTMFQGSVVDWGDDTGYHGCSPIMQTTMAMGMQPINLCNNDTTQYQRFVALAIADTYAHQVDEYRRWIYNNQSRSFAFSAYGANSHTFSITRETVPDNLISPLGVAGGTSAASYRSNPFAPWDMDGNPLTQDHPYYDPEPPFRNIADLLNVALYPGNINLAWLQEGFDTNYGPDPEEEVTEGGVNFHVVPTAIDENDDTNEAAFDDAFIGPNALAVWGPIYQTEFAVTNGLRAGDDYTLDSWIIPTSSHCDVTSTSKYYKQQRFRLFSADDFKWISPYITTRSYVYRVESRGIVRVANGTNKLDVTRDKYYVIDFGNNTYLNFDTTGWENDSRETIDVRTPINGNNSNQPYVVRAFEEIPADGLSLTRRMFTPPEM